MKPRRPQPWRGGSSRSWLSWSVRWPAWPPRRQKPDRSAGLSWLTSPHALVRRLPMLPHCSPPALFQQSLNSFPSVVSVDFESEHCRACSSFLDGCCLEETQHERCLHPTGELEAATQAEAAAVDAEDFEKAAALSAQADAAKARLTDLHLAVRAADGACERLVCPLPPPHLPARVSTTC